MDVKEAVFQWMEKLPYLKNYLSCAFNVSMERTWCYLCDFYGASSSLENRFFDEFEWYTN